MGRDDIHTDSAYLHWAPWLRNRWRLPSGLSVLSLHIVGAEDWYSLWLVQVFGHQFMNICWVMEVKFPLKLNVTSWKTWLVSFTLLLLYSRGKTIQLTLNRMDGAQSWSRHSSGEEKYPSSCRNWNALSSCCDIIVIISNIVYVFWS